MVCGFDEEAASVIFRWVRFKMETEDEFAGTMFLNRLLIPVSPVWGLSSGGLCTVIRMIQPSLISYS